MAVPPVTREEAVRLLSEAGVPLQWPESYALPISRVELTRRLMDRLDRSDVVDFDPQDEDFIAFLVMAVEDALSIDIVEEDWVQADPRTFTDLVLFTEEVVRRRWHGRLARVPGGCASQSVFYAVRRMLGEGMAYRARPADPLPPAFRAADPLRYALLRQYGVSLPRERRVFGRLPIAGTWAALWVVLWATLLAAISVEETVVIVMFGALPILGLVCALSRPAWPGEFRTFGDVVRFVVAEHARNHERMRLALRRADA